MDGRASEQQGHPHAGQSAYPPRSYGIQQGFVPHGPQHFPHASFGQAYGLQILGTGGFSAGSDEYQGATVGSAGQIARSEVGVMPFQSQATESLGYVAGGRGLLGSMYPPGTGYSSLDTGSAQSWISGMSDLAGYDRASLLVQGPDWERGRERERFKHKGSPQPTRRDEVGRNISLPGTGLSVQDWEHERERERFKHKGSPQRGRERERDSQRLGRTAPRLSQPPRRDEVGRKFSRPGTGGLVQGHHWQRGLERERSKRKHSPQRDQETERNLQRPRRTSPRQSPQRDEVGKKISPPGTVDFREELLRTIDEEYHKLKDQKYDFNLLINFISNVIKSLVSNKKVPTTLQREFCKAVWSRESQLDEENWLELVKQCAAGKHSAIVDVKQQQQEEDQLRKEFEAEYKDPKGSILSYFLDNIDQRYAKWSKDSKTWYAPCSAIVQSSGWGKSRAVREIAMASNQVMVFYFSLMDPNHRGFPRSDPDILRHFRNITKVENAYALFCACFAWLSEQTTFPSKKDLFIDHQEKQYHRILPKIQTRPECSKECMRKTCYKAMNTHATSLRSNGVCFLFVLDEARTLLQPPEAAMGGEFQGELPFVLFRRASAELPSEGRSFVIFIDTTSRVSNFTPASRKDPSLRVVRGLKNLFAPISRLPTFDLICASSSSMSLDTIASPQIWFRQGRPLWTSKTISEEEWVSEISQFAQSKLLGGFLINSSEGRNLLRSPHMSLVLLGRLIGVDVCPQSSTAEELVASHMSVCLHVSASREYVLCTSLPEPALNEAASIALRKSRKLMKQQLGQLNSLLLSGIASAGERGELVARFLLINAMNSLQQPDSPTQPVFLEDFLKAFIPQFKEFSPALKHLKLAKVFFNSFHRFFGKPSVQDAKKFIKKGAAMICAERQQAFDLYILYVQPNEKQEYDLADNNSIGCLGVQVRNWQHVSGIPETLNNMQAYARKIALTGADEVLPTLLMILHVGVKNVEHKGTKETRKGKEKSKGKKKINEEGGYSMMGDALVLEGLDSISIPEDFREIITLLLCQSPDPITVIRSENEAEERNEAYERMMTVEEMSRETKALGNILYSVYPEGVDKTGPSFEVQIGIEFGSDRFEK